MAIQVFKVSVVKGGEETDGEGFRLRVENRAGRAWIRKDPEWDAGNAAEDALALSEWLAYGGKLQNPDHWEEEPRG